MKNYKLKTPNDCPSRSLVGVDAYLKEDFMCFPGYNRVCMLCKKLCNDDVRFPDYCPLEDYKE